MQITSTDTLAGQPIIKVRDFLYDVKGMPWTIDHMMSFFEIDQVEAHFIIDSLKQSGYIEDFSDNSNEQCWINTLNGNSLALASAAKLIKRETADKKINEFLERVKDANKSGFFALK